MIYIRISVYTVYCVLTQAVYINTLKVHRHYYMIRPKKQLHPTSWLFTLHFPVPTRISTSSAGPLLSGIHWNWAAQAITPRYSTPGLEMSRDSSTG